MNIDDMKINFFYLAKDTKTEYKYQIQKSEDSRFWVKNISFSLWEQVSEEYLKLHFEIIKKRANRINKEIYKSNHIIHQNYIIEVFNGNI